MFNFKNKRYQFILELGTGGMSNVYLAFDHEQQRQVAIKTLRDDRSPPAATAGPQAIDRFRWEIDILKRLRHKNIIELYDDFIEDDKHYMVMEYVEGGSARKRIYDLHSPFNSQEVCTFGVQLASALAAAHGQGIIHRDVKPSNILLAEEGQVRLSDFGVARLKETCLIAPDRTMTITGNAPVTNAYRCPESTLPNWKANEQSDVWSLGVTFFEMLTGRLPWNDRDKDEVIYQIQNVDVPRFAASSPVWPELEQIVRKMLAKDPADRYPNMLKVGEDLEKALSIAAASDDQTRPSEFVQFAPWPIRKTQHYSLEYGRSWAVLIAPGEYQDGHIPSTPQHLVGVWDLSALLWGKCQFDVQTLFKNQATLKSIYRVIGDLQNCLPNDRLIIYWAGAARSETDASGERQSFLAAYDTHWEDCNTFLDVADLIDIRLVQAKHILFIFDAPTLGPLQRRWITLPEEPIAVDTAMYNSALHVLSAGLQHYPHDGPTTLFTATLLDGLRGAAAENGFITADTLGRYVTRQVEVHSRGVQQVFHARLQGGEYGTFLLHVPDTAYLPRELLDSVHSEHVKIRLSTIPILQDYVRESSGPGQRLAISLLRQLTEDRAERVRADADQALKELANENQSITVLSPQQQPSDERTDPPG